MSSLKTIILCLGLMATAAELPLPQPLSIFAQCGVIGLALFLVWWAMAKTIPEIQRAHTEQLKQLSDSNAVVIKQFTDAIKELRTAR